MLLEGPTSCTAGVDGGVERVALIPIYMLRSPVNLDR